MTTNEPPRKAFQQLRERKLVQWALAYLAGAWLLLQVLDVTAEPWGLSLAWVRAIQLTVIVGFALTLILAWYHGDKGRQRVGTVELLAIAGVLGTGAIAWSLVGPSGRATGTNPVIAVLPFAHLGSDSTDMYFAEAMSEELRIRLAKVRAVDVISRPSMAAYRETGASSRRIGQELGADYLIDGGVLRAGDAVRIQVQLIDAVRDAPVWADTFDRELSVRNLFAVQSEITETIAGEVRAEIAPGELGDVRAVLTESEEAYDLFLRGRSYLNRAGGTTPPTEDAELAVQMFERALEADPTFAEAYAWASIAHAQVYNNIAARSDARVEAMRLNAERALELDPESPDAHLAIGILHYQLRDFARATPALERAADGLPSEPWLGIVRAYVQARQNRMGPALALARQAERLNPRDRFVLDQASHLYLFGREYDEAEALLRRLEAMEPNHDSLHLSEIMFYRDGDPTALLRRGPQARWLAKIAMGDLDAALATLYGISREEINPQGRSGAPRYPKSLFVGTTHALAGRPDEARAIFEATRQVLESEPAETQDDRIAGVLSSSGRDAQQHLTLGLTYAALGRTEDALREAGGVEELLQDYPDAVVAGSIALDLVWLYAAAGAHDEALDWLDAYLALPGWWSVLSISLDPRFAAIRSHPGFQTLLTDGR